MAIRSSSGSLGKGATPLGGRADRRFSLDSASEKSSDTTVLSLRCAWAVRSRVRSWAERAFRTRSELNIGPTCGSNKRDELPRVRWVGGVGFNSRVMHVRLSQLAVFEGERRQAPPPSKRAPSLARDSSVRTKLFQFGQAWFGPIVTERPRDAAQLGQFDSAPCCAPWLPAPPFSFFSLVFIGFPVNIF